RLPEGTQTLATRLKARGFATGAVVSTFVLDRRFGTSQGFGSSDTRVDAVHKIGDLSERKGDEAARHATEWLDQPNEPPLFLFPPPPPPPAPPSRPRPAR